MKGTQDMNAEAIAVPNINERASFRLPYQGEFEYTCDNTNGTACWSSVSHHGACIRMGRYLKPGRLIRISQDNHELIGNVVWYKPTHEDKTFVAGIRFMDNGVEASFLVLSTMVQHMLNSHNLKQQPLALL